VPTPRAPLPTAPTVTAPVQAQPTATSSPIASPAAPAPAPAPAPAAALEATLRMAGQGGFTRARVTLRPAELGGVEVFLREGSAGLTATVVADTPHAAQLLQSSATELQRRLAAQGLELASLQISVGGESAGAAHGGHDGRPAAQAPGTAPRDAAGEPEIAAQMTQTIDLGGGVLVDVLA
jgi:flagellar hook-length control protein FliK